MEFQLEVILVLLGIISFMSVFASWIRLPFPVLLVLAGLGIGLVPGLPAIEVHPDVIFLLVLPPLLYSSAFLFAWKDFRSNIRSIFLLAIGLVLVTTIAVAYTSWWLIPGMTLAAGFVLGAVVSPPDAVAAGSVLQRLSVPTRIQKVLQGESLVNDASGLVAYQFAVAALVAGTFSMSSAAVDFVWISTAGTGMGLALAWVISQILRRIQEPVVELTISIMTPFMVYLAAEAIGGSGILAVVAAGMFMGHHSDEIFSGKARLDMDPVWGFTRHLLDSLVFILIGLEFPVIMRQLSPMPGSHLIVALLLVIGVVIVVRFAWIFSVSWFLKRVFIPRALQEPPIENKHLVVMSWCGMRGVVSMAAALAIPRINQAGEPTPERDLILFLTFGVIFATLILPSISLPAIVRKLQAGVEKGSRESYTQARLQLASKAEELISQIAKRENIPEDSVPVVALRQHFLRVRELFESRGTFDQTDPGVGSDQMAAMVREIFSDLRKDLRTQSRGGQMEEDDRLLLRQNFDAEEQRLLRFFGK